MAPAGPEPASPAEIDAHLKRVDPDRWLSARLIADPAARADVLALYALEDAVRRVAAGVTQPLLGEMRLAWWAEAVDDLAAGRPAGGHPALLALAGPLAAGRLPLEPLRRLIDARRADLDPAPFADDAALDAFLDGAYAAPMQAAAVRLDPAPVLDSLAPAARAWGLASLVRETPAWLAAGRRWAPPAWGDDPAAWTARARAETATTLAASRAALKTLPVASWPAVAHASLARAYVGGRSPGELERRVRIVAASLVGRI